MERIKLNLWVSRGLKKMQSRPPFKSNQSQSSQYKRVVQAAKDKKQSRPGMALSTVRLDHQMEVLRVIPNHLGMNPEQVSRGGTSQHRLDGGNGKIRLENEGPRSELVSICGLRSICLNSFLSELDLGSNERVRLVQDPDCGTL